MPTQDLHSYIKQKQIEGLSDEQIKANLLSVGWDAISINAAFSSDIPLPTATNLPSQAEESMWSSFQNILTFISLGFFAGALHVLWSSFISHWFPINKNYYGYTYTDYIINPALAALFVSAPLFIILFYFTNKRYVQNPVLKRAKSKKVLNYLTLIITFFILITRVIAAVYTVLDNSLTVAFAANLAVTATIIGAIFIYYLYEVRLEKAVTSLTPYYVGCIALLIITVVTIVIALPLKKDVKNIISQQKLNYGIPAETSGTAPTKQASNLNDKELAVGSTFYLPPTSTPITSGNWRVRQGRISAVDQLKLVLANNAESKSNGVYYWQENTVTTDYNVDDCVSVVYDTKGLKIIQVVKKDGFNSQQCIYGSESPLLYMEAYTTVIGDTTNSIVTKKYGSLDRVDEVALINKLAKSAN